MKKISCYIQKNTPELRLKLDELGYDPLHGGYFFETDHKYLCVSNDVYSTFNIEEITFSDGSNFLKEDNYIDCEENEELFLQLASLGIELTSDIKIEYYTPTDNSYAIDLGSGKHAYPAGYVLDKPAITLKVLVQPFQMEIINCVGDKETRTFIIGADLKTTKNYLVLYY